VSIFECGSLFTPVTLTTNPSEILISLYLSDIQKFDLLSREEEYHPLFEKYDFVIEYFELFISTLGKNLDDVVEEIKNREGIEIAKEFQKNIYNIKGKTLEF